ncbi:hypothetical protein [Xenorhabdus bharatensis]|uniref:hypothetical protein n=1 Tax=Xenorhabdus bharatensis TaxID=3136256 RepID=UPI0030F44E50
MAYADQLHRSIFLLSQRVTRLKHLPILLEPWEQAEDNEIYELRFSLVEESKYVLINIADKTETTPDGWYVFVNRVDEPGIIRMVSMSETEHGHSSLTHYRYQKGGVEYSDNISVYYAGLAVFKKGELVTWSNASGHYKPKPELHRNFIPYVSRLLPSHLFEEVKTDCVGDIQNN